MEAHIVAAADRADVKARWSPLEKKGSMKAENRVRAHSINYNLTNLRRRQLFYNDFRRTMEQNN